MPEAAGNGPVEREARQLVEAAARWLSAVPDNHEYAARTVDLEADAEATVESEEAGETLEGEAGFAGVEGGHGAEGESSGEHLCHGCPWCRAKAAAGPIGADTLDSIAHLLSAAAESVSLFAQSRREATQESADEADETSHAEGASPAGGVEDVIEWADEDEDALLADEECAPTSPPQTPASSPTKEGQTP